MSEREKPPNRFTRQYKMLNQFSLENPGIRFVLLIVLVGLVILVLVSQCRSLTERDGIAEPPESPAEMFQADKYYRPNEIILTGSLEEINVAISSISGIDQESPTIISMGQSLDIPQTCPGLNPKFTAGSDFVIALYQTERDIVQTLEEIQTQIENESLTNVSASPNRLVGSPDYPVGSTSTWEVKPAKDNLFPNQWAFDSEHIALFHNGNNDDGDGVRIGIFDTSPDFGVNIESSSDGNNTPEQPVTVSWVNWPTPLELTLVYPPGLSRPDSEAESAGKTKDLSDHGLFVTALVHAIAPDSTIELIRVLEDDNTGDLFTLNMALYDFIMATEQGEPTVINMSLGIRIPPPKAEFQIPTNEVESLRNLILLARCKNIVVIAASGNNSSESYPPELAHLPADWTSVIGVSASNKDNQRACFSNQGEIAAPGGDGGETIDPLLSCGPRIRECPEDTVCDYSVVGPVIPKPSNSETNYIHWVGSSFAAPMVTGLAARVLDIAQETGLFLSPADVRAIIECGAKEAQIPDGIEGHPDRYVGEGIINVRRTLTECIPNAPQ